MPGGPTTSIIPPWPSRTRATASRSAVFSRWRPTNGSSGEVVRLLPSGPRTTAASTAAFLPLAMNGSTGLEANSMSAASSTAVAASTSPGAARAITRAARLTVSPITV